MFAWLTRPLINNPIMNISTPSIQIKNQLAHRSLLGRRGHHDIYLKMKKYYVSIQ